MRVLLDTVTFIWAVSSPELLSATAMSALTHQDATRELSAISLSEIAIKAARGKLDFRKDDIEQGLTDLRIQVLPYKAEHAWELFTLPLLHADPFDRQIIAQAMVEGIAIVTSDRSFGLYPNLRVIW